MTEDTEHALLLTRVQQGDADAFTELVQRYAAALSRTAYRFTGDMQAAEDIVQEAFLSVWQKPYQWDAARGSTFRAWIYRVVINRALNYRKRAALYERCKAFVTLSKPKAPEDILLQSEEQRLLARAVQALPERQQIALTLCFYQELSNQEAAEIMGIGVKALESLLMRAKAALRRHIPALR